jgi:hypothetical protein
VVLLPEREQKHWPTQASLTISCATCTGCPALRIQSMRFWHESEPPYIKFPLYSHSSSHSPTGSTETCSTGPCCTGTY